MPAPKNKLKSFGKNRREVRPAATTYDEEGNWVGTPHQDKMRLVTNKVFDTYYGTLQQLGRVAACTAGVSPSSSSSPAAAAVPGDVSAETATACWAKEMELFRTPLLTTFWVNDTDPLAPQVRAYMETLDPALVEPIAWYPVAGMGWRILADKTEFRKRPEMQALRQFLIQQTALGTISRQEEVSMIPPFLLDIQPNDVCLDMCASPGSKTAQMLVALGRLKVVPFDSDASPFPFQYDSDGLVIANELDTKRANMLVHQVKRLRLLFPFALFTNHDARYFPEMTLRGPAGAAAGTTTTEETGEVLRFDKILCDVVCSGDGTLRKAPHIFKLWSPKEAINLQKLQIQIALRACHLLRVGGRLVYSTCSLNPVENEAVVAQIVHRTRGAMRLVDARALLPQLVCAPGMTTWTVTDAKGRVFAAPEGNMHEALFPPHTPGGYDSPAVDQLDLSLCMRLFPSHCKGGGFFVAVLDKVSEFRLKKLEELKAEEAEAAAAAVSVDGVSADQQSTSGPHSQDHKSSSSTNGGSAPPKRERKEAPEVSGDGDDALETELAAAPEPTKPRSLPPQFVAAPVEIQRTITNFYEIASFPMQLLFVRTAQGERELRLSAGSVCSIVSRMAAAVLRHKTDSVVIVSAGLRVIAFECLDKGWRIASESAVLFAKLMRHSSRLVRVPVPLIQDMIVHGGKLKEKLLDSIEDAQLRATLEGLSLGTVLLEIVAPNAQGGILYSVALRARSRMQLLVDHEDLEGMQLRLGETPVAPAAKSPAAEGDAEA